MPIQYWPEQVGDCRTFGTGSSAVNVKLHAHDNHGVYHQRTLTYAKASETGEHEVVQFVFDQWPTAGDQPVPASSGALLDLIGRVLKRQTREQTTAGPIVVHCRYALIAFIRIRQIVVTAHPAAACTRRCHCYWND
jgi:protein tyrosine phosphatase